MKEKKRPNWFLRIGIAVVLLILCVFENTHLVTSFYTYELEEEQAELAGYRIVQISDLHNASFGHDNRTLLKKIEELSPDMIVLTGDLVDGNRTNVTRALGFVKQAVEIAPVYYVTGNHEYWISEEKQKELLAGLQEAGALCLMNESVRIETGKYSFALIGLDDESLFDQTLWELKKQVMDDFTVVLAHEPQYINRYSAAKADLVFTGHAHGGQVRLPFFGPLVAPGQGFFPQYAQGIYRQDQTTMVVSRGLGNSIIPVRVFNDPEIVCMDFAVGK